MGRIVFHSISKYPMQKYRLKKLKNNAKRTKTIKMRNFKP
jgi:hypothetical protein